MLFRLIPVHATFGTATVVRQKENQRIFELSELAKLVNDPADVFIHPLDLRGIDFSTKRGFVLLAIADANSNPGNLMASAL